MLALIYVSAPTEDQVSRDLRNATDDQAAYIIDSAITKGPIKLTLMSHHELECGFIFIAERKAHPPLVALAEV